MMPTWYNEYKKIIDESINKYLDLYFNRWEIYEWLSEFKEAVYYSVKSGKRIRSILALEFYLIFSKKKLAAIKFWDDIILYCIAIELLHSYSLVHDDLPSMDNDEYRRWELTVWKKYNEATATLVWDLLNSMSFEILSDLWEETDIKILLSYFGRAVWMFWMLGWQVLDLYYEKNIDKLDINKLIDIHNKKTGALIEASIVWWIILTNKFDDIEEYMDFWKKIWLAFQIKDDILDVEWTKDETWKSVGNEKKWFVHFIWIDESKKKLDLLLEQCKQDTLKLNSEKITFLINYIWSRNK